MKSDPRLHCASKISLAFLPHLIYYPDMLTHAVSAPGTLIIMKKQIEYLQGLFYDIWNDFGSVYIVVKYSHKTIVGKRGFTEEDKKNGLILVFNNKTNTSIEWDADGNISCVLAFGARKEDVFIHHDDLAGVFSPDAGVQFFRSDMMKSAGGAPDAGPETGHDERVVSISNFKRKPKSSQ